MTDKKTVYSRMEELHKLITHHAHIYFVEDREEISNHEYDDLELEWNKLAGEHPEIAELFEFYDKPVPIHEPTGDRLTPVKLNTTMLSLAKALGWDPVQNFFKRFEPDTAYVYEVKLDGLALELRYVKGMLVQMVTRGAGMVGEDVTHAIPLFCNIPLQLPSGNRHGVTIPDEFNVRGEGFVTISHYHNYNEISEKKKANPRSAASGWVRASKENQDEKAIDLLNFAVYWSSDELGAQTYEQWKEFMRDLGFDTPPPASLAAVEENLRSDLVPSDGIVIKVNSLALQRKAGVTNKHPRWAIAYKYPPEESFPSISDIEWNTTKTGRVVPVGIYTPTRMGGVICQRALLDNYKNFMSLELRKGSVVSVTRNNDVIPRLNHVVKAGKGKLFKAPTECPSCGFVLEVRAGKESADLVCNNVSGCPEQLTQRCVTFADKFGMDIDGLGPVTIADLIDRGYVKMPIDLLKLGKYGFISDRVRANIEAAMVRPIHRVIKALCFPDVGVVLAKRVGNALVTSITTEILQDGVEDKMKDVKFLTSIKGISTGTAIKIIQAFENPMFEENVKETLKRVLIDMSVIPENDFKVCVTGSLGQPRDDLFKYFAEHDIEATAQLTKDCKYVIVGEKPGQSKLLKATELGIPMLYSNEYSSIDAIIAFIKGN